jgi:hypothetical protein
MELLQHLFIKQPYINYSNKCKPLAKMKEFYYDHGKINKNLGDKNEIDV